MGGGSPLRARSTRIAIASSLQFVASGVYLPCSRRRRIPSTICLNRGSERMFASSGSRSNHSARPSPARPRRTRACGRSRAMRSTEIRRSSTCPDRGSWPGQTIQRTSNTKAGFSIASTPARSSPGPSTNAASPAATRRRALPDDSDSRHPHRHRDLPGRHRARSGAPLLLQAAGYGGARRVLLRSACTRCPPRRTPRSCGVRRERPRARGPSAP